MLKHMSSITYNSGLRELIEDNLIHKSIYKQLKVNYSNKNEKLFLSFSFSYAIALNDKKSSSLSSILGLNLN